MKVKLNRHVHCGGNGGPMIDILPQGGEHHEDGRPPEKWHQCNNEKNGEVRVEPSPRRSGNYGMRIDYVSGLETESHTTAFSTGRSVSQ